MALDQIVHRPGPYKQVNKPHKSDKGNSKRNDKGKQNVKVMCHSKKHDLNRKERKNRANQIRSNKKEAAMMRKRGLGELPILVALLPLDGVLHSNSFLDALKTCSDDLHVSSSEKFNNCHINFLRQKQRYTFMVPNKTDLHSVMDTVKIVDVLLIIHSTGVLSIEDETLLSIILAHAYTTTIHVVQGMDKLNPKKKSELRKNVLKSMESRFPDEKLHQVDTAQEFQMLLRHLALLKRRPLGFRDARPQLLAENIAYCPNNDDEGFGTLKVTGFVRGQTLNVNGLVHVPGWGDYQMSCIDYHDDPYVAETKNTKSKSNKIKSDEMNVDNLIHSDQVDVAIQESLQSEVVPDPMEAEQTWPTQEELEEAEQNNKNKAKVKRVPKGTSEYQASWIIDSEDSSEDSEDEELKANKEDTMSEDLDLGNMDCEKIELESSIDIKNEDYDANMDLDEEQQMLVRFNEEKLNRQFPDEKDTPIDIKARIKFQKYRGLKNFKNSPWDPMENLPLDYARIYRFERFRQTKKKVLNAEREGATKGSYVTLHITNVPQSVYDSFEDSAPLIVYGLLTHEQKMSVMNVTLRKHATCGSTIMSKDSLIFHIGFRRFTCNPIFSEHRLGNKFKCERFLSPDVTVVASFYAPVMFPPAPVVVLRQKQDGTQELVATGNVLDVNPNRVIVKRIVLTGHSFRIFKKSAIIRFMFFNTEDINWFKRIELRTRGGRVGHIKEPLGTHGHMRCVFDDQLTSNDVVIMNLYKRVFPKWTYDSQVPTPVMLCQSEDDDDDVSSMK